MLLRNAYAAVLQLLRARLGLTQHDIAMAVTPSHVSQLEAVKTSATLEVSQELAQALNLHPVSLLTLVHAANDLPHFTRRARALLPGLCGLDHRDFQRLHHVADGTG